MNKKEAQKLGEVLERLVDGFGKTVQNQEQFLNLLDQIVGLISFLMKSVSIIFFIINLLIWRVFLWKPLTNSLNSISELWKSLPEGYQILILGFFGAIISGIIANIATAFLLEKINDILRKK